MAKDQRENVSLEIVKHGGRITASSQEGNFWFQFHMLICYKTCNKSLSISGIWFHHLINEGGGNDWWPYKFRGLKSLRISKGQNVCASKRKI